MANFGIFAITLTIKILHTKQASIKAAVTIQKKQFLDSFISQAMATNSECFEHFKLGKYDIFSKIGIENELTGIENHSCLFGQ